MKRAIGIDKDGLRGTIEALIVGLVLTGIGLYSLDAIGTASNPLTMLLALLFGISMAGPGIVVTLVMAITLFDLAVLWFRGD